MKIELKTEGNIVIAVISGDIDSTTAPKAQAELMKIIEKENKLVMEMSGVRFLSSAGLRMLLLLYRQATAKNGEIVLVGLSSEIRDVMSMTGFLGYFVVSDSLETVLHSGR